MMRNLCLLIGLANPLMAQQPTRPAVTLTATPNSAVQSTTSDPVQNELDAQKLKLKMPIGASSASFDLSDSARRAMINSPSVLHFSDQIQLTKQDSVTMRGLMDLPIASLSEVVSKMDFYTQIRFIRFGLLQINGQPQEARLYASKLYILTDEIFPRKAIQDSLMVESALAEERTKIQQRTLSTPTVTSIKEQSSTTDWSWLPSGFLLVIVAVGGYYWFVFRPKAKKTGMAVKKSPEDESTQEITNATNLLPDDRATPADNDEGINGPFATHSRFPDEPSDSEAPSPEAIKQVETTPH